MARSKRENQGILDDSKNPAREGMRRKGTHYAHSHGLPWLRICASTAGEQLRSLAGALSCMPCGQKPKQQVCPLLGASALKGPTEHCTQPRITGVDTEVCVSSTVSNE